MCLKGWPRKLQKLQGIFDARQNPPTRIAAFSGQILRVNCTAMLPFGDIIPQRNQLLVARAGLAGDSR
jgi:hypothetical protein